MFSSSLTKFCAVSGLILLFLPGCHLGRRSDNLNSLRQASADEPQSELPFATREPENFQAEIVVTMGDTQRRTFIARNGAFRRFDFNAGAKNQATSLRTDKNYLILPDYKVYAESESAPAGEGDDWTEFLTTKWLSERTGTQFEKLETAENLTKYRVRAGDGAEVHIYYDEQLGMPVKQEFYAVSGEAKSLTYVYELRNVKLETDADLFTLPANFKKIPLADLRKLRRGEQ